MESWYAGRFLRYSRFEVFREEGRDVSYHLKVNSILYERVRVFIEDRQELTLTPAPELRSMFVIDAPIGRFVFPWRWGHDSSDWPRFEPVGGYLMRLLRLERERGQLVQLTSEHRHWMQLIYNRAIRRRQALLGQS